MSLITRTIKKLSLAVAVASFLSHAAVKTGPEIGQEIPDFSAPDQDGKLRSLKSIAGPKGAMLVFYRSADW